MNTVEALKELYKSFGGKLTDTYSNIADGIPVGNYSVIPDCFAALAEIAGGSIELPEVTATDNGSVLSVVDGAWAKSFNLYDDGTNLSVTGGSTEISIPIGDLTQDAIINLVLKVTAENGSLALQNAMGDNLATIFSGNLKASTLTIIRIIKVNSGKYLFTFGNDFYYFANASSIYNTFKLKITGAAISNGTCTMYKR